MSKGITSDDCLVRLHRNSRNLFQQLARRIKLLSRNARLVCVTVRTHSQRHNDFFKRSIARAFTDSVDRALHLPSAVCNRRQRVCDRQPEIIVAMSRDNHVLRAWYPLANAADQVTEFCGNRVADRIRDIQRSGACLNHRSQNLEQKFRISSCCVFRRELDVITECSRQPDRLRRLIKTLLSRNAQLVLQVNVRCRQKYVDARANCRL